MIPSLAYIRHSFFTFLFLGSPNPPHPQISRAVLFCDTPYITVIIAISDSREALFLILLASIPMVLVFPQSLTPPPLPFFIPPLL